MKAYLFRLAIVLLLLAGSRPVFADPRVIGLFYVMKPGTNEVAYTVALIDSDSKEHLPNEKAVKLTNQVATRLLARAHRWVNAELRARYPDEDPKKFDAMLETESPLDDRSVMVMVFQGKGTRKFAGTLRYERVTKEKPRLGLEEALHYDYPRRYRVEHYDHNDPTRKQAPTIVGDPMEIKNLVVGRNVPDNLVPFMYYAGEIVWASSPGRELDPSNPKLAVYPSDYLLRCHKRMVPYYRELGFVLATRKRFPNGDYVMKMNRKKFLRIGRKVFPSLARSRLAQGYRLVTELETDWHPMVELYWRKLRNYSCVDSAVKEAFATVLRERARIPGPGLLGPRNPMK